MRKFASLSLSLSSFVKHHCTTFSSRGDGLLKPHHSVYKEFEFGLESNPRRLMDTTLLVLESENKERIKDYYDKEFILNRNSSKVRE